MAGTILLVYPNIARAERYRGWLGVFGGRQIPLGIYYLAAYLRDHGYDVHALDAEAQGVSDSDIVARIGRTRYDAIGVSMTTALFDRGYQLARSIKAAAPSIPLIAGGPHVSGQPVETLRESVFDLARSRCSKRFECSRAEAIPPEWAGSFTGAKTGSRSPIRRVRPLRIWMNCRCRHTT